VTRPIAGKSSEGAERATASGKVERRAPEGTSERRLARVRKRLRANKLATFIVARQPNIAWLTGLTEFIDEGFFGAAIVSLDEAFLLTDARFEEQARAETAQGPWKVVVVTERLSVALATIVKRRGAIGPGRAGIESTVLHELFVGVAKALGEEPRPMRGLVEREREVKDEHEIGLVARAARITDTAFQHACKRLAPGITERELALEIEVAMRRAGASGVAFPTIVASGPNGSRPHAQATDRPLERGDLVILDLGAVFGGYRADMTRTVALGPIDEERRAVYEHVRRAQQLALDVARAGVTGRELDLAARSYLTEKGLGRNFGHGLGHGVGLEVHELPSISRRGRGHLRAGEVFTIEPGAYVPRRFGVRIEDLVVLTAEGVHDMSASSKDLLTL
jgi:Xaa-Pro aminopeptidase